MNVFRYSTSKKELQKAAAWMEKYYQKNPKELQTDADGLDTYAILLYKSGKVKEAIEWEEKAVKIDSKNNELVDNLAKMKKGLRIWPEGFDVAD
jgi:tetratricopeptide (TPR) repeat protein